MNLSSNRPRYHLARKEERAIFIVDMCDKYECMSVTNGAEVVTKELYEEYGDKQFFYKDTEGQWDELVHNKGTFTKFKFGVNLN